MNYSQYDEIANKYDAFFTDKESIEENNAVSQMLSDVKGRVYDIGCGTGLLTEIIEISPKKYYGIDPSKEMLNKFVEKHPEYKFRVVQETFESDASNLNEFDWVVSLFGSISYVEPNMLKKISESDTHHFLMFYKEKYHPITYTLANVEFNHFRSSTEELSLLFPYSTIKEFNNYIIVSR